MMHLPRFLFINGPSGSGKSTLAELLCSSNEKCWRENFAEPIRDMIRTVFFPEEGPIHYEHDLRDGAIKKQSLLQLAKMVAMDDRAIAGNYVSVRTAMIEFSETYMKPTFGPDVFGRLLWKRCQEMEHWYDHFIIDDSDFVSEVQYIVSQAGAARCALIHLRRAGTNFSGDSRGYVDLHGVRTIDLDNDGAAAEMVDQLALEFGNL